MLSRRDPEGETEGRREAAGKAGAGHPRRGPEVSRRDTAGPGADEPRGTGGRREERGPSDERGPSRLRVPGLVQDLVAVVGRAVARWAFYRDRLGFALDHELQLVAGGVQTGQ